MKISNLEKGSLIREKQRASLTKRVAAVGINVEKNNNSYLSRSFDSGSRSISVTGHQVQATVNGAVAAAGRAIKDSGLSGLKFVKASHKIESEARSARMHVIKEASFNVSYSFPTTDGERTASKNIEVGVVLENGRYSVLGLNSVSGYLPLTKSNLKAASNYTSKDFEDEDLEDYLDESYDKEEKPKSNKYVLDKKRKRESDSEEKTGLHKEGDKWATYSEKGTKLGEHLTREKALKQLEAYEFHKNNPHKAAKEINYKGYKIIDREKDWFVPNSPNKESFGDLEDAKQYIDRIPKNYPEHSVKVDSLKKKVAQSNILPKPEDSSITNADSDTEMIRQDALNIQSKVNALEAQVKSYQDALASKTAQELGIDAKTYAELQNFLAITQNTLNTKIKNLEGNFIKFADGITYAKVQGARLNDASWKDMIDSARTNGRGVMKRVTSILDKISILFKKMTANVSLKEYAPGELTPKEISKVTDNNTKNVNKINKYQEDIKKQAPNAQKYFLNSAEGLIQPPGFKGAQKEQQLEFGFLQELDAQLDEQNEEIEKTNAEIDALVKQVDQQTKLDEAYPLPRGASKGIHFTSAKPGPAIKVRRTIASLKAKGFSTQEITEYLESK